jgi:3'(2'), 5'-bisphosphate nucleotidase
VPADAELARELANEAGALLLSLRRSNADLPAEELKALGDRAAQELLSARLSASRPADAVLSEEAVDSPARLAGDRVWIIDPLDGTREFSEGRSDWAVHVALWEADGNAGVLTAGAVALPGLDIVLATDVPVRVPPPAGGSPRMAVSRTRPPAIADMLADTLGFEPVPMGSAGYKVAAVIRGEVDLYVHAGGQYEWDSAAPVAVALAAGLHASRIDGSPLRYNRPNPLLPDLLVCRPELADRVLAAIAEVAA